MARREVIQIICDRCSKPEYRPISNLEKLEKEKEPDFSASFQDSSIVFEDLCKKCMGVAQSTWVRLMLTVHKTETKTTSAK